MERLATLLFDPVEFTLRDLRLEGSVVVEELAWAPDVAATDAVALRIDRPEQARVLADRPHLRGLTTGYPPKSAT